MGRAGEGVAFEVGRPRWEETRVAPVPRSDALDDGQVELRVDRFALTANNVTYAVAGEMLDYWGFFPAEEGWGRIPVMGFGDVLRSAHPDVDEGERYFGFFPMATHLTIQAKPHPEGVVDAAPHRSGHAPVYRQYTRTKDDPLWSADGEDALMLLRGLFLTSFLIDDFVEDNARFGARRLVVSSASSKTSIALAFQAAQREGLEVVGLTSPAHTAFVEGLGFYDTVLSYDAIESIPSDVPSIFVDMAGNADVVRRIHDVLGPALRHHAMVGATHWQAGGPSPGEPAVEPVFFFAPAQAGKRAAEWGAAGLQARLADAWGRFAKSTPDWLEVRRHSGPDAVAAVYADTLAGRTEPRHGNVLSLWAED
jgi:hypothetical protein